ncbi:oligopeptide/dipeptide ABC transporter ATP-binding protein [Bradyrhizobium sp. cir1]|uniref:ABC transporter ATP-binding protein n=1 Tax=Bradyrhizobium sp. cir1 TaxID=1445730 RepID=UPI00179C1857|nr:ABC transporter ATP-binding protein [Bradyrhizobium sp. cir1]MBB4375157.1 oligopeptide/dipeptide ABC transporter ATP-binding protein [Bradyrhizobium sp. cir1]
MTAAPLLQVENLQMHLHLRRGVVKAVDGVSFHVHEGETLGIVGESGSGKTMTCLSILRLLPIHGDGRLEGSVKLDGDDLLQLTEEEMASRVRGPKVAMISQDPMTSLNPVFTVGDQVSGPFRYHKLVRTVREAMSAATAGLRRVRIPSPERRLKNYPHQFSGGMRQRVVTAMAIACSPRLLIADEPTTALDVTIQVQIMSLLRSIQRDSKLGIILITHDLSIVAGLCHRIAVMYAGRIIETGKVRDIYRNPQHPYTQALLEAIPHLGQKRKRLAAIPGQPPNLMDLPTGCRFAPRCPKRMAVCDDYPPATELGDGHVVNCWLAAKQ